MSLNGWIADFTVDTIIMRARKNLGFLEKIFQGFLDFIISVYKEDQTKIQAQKERRIHHYLCHIF